MAKPKKTAATEDELGALLPTRDAAPLLGVEPNTLLQWRHRGYGPVSFKSGGKVVWPEKPLLAWRAARYAETARGGA